MIESTELFFITSCWVQGWRGLFFRQFWGAPRYKEASKYLRGNKQSWILMVTGRATRCSFLFLGNLVEKKWSPQVKSCCACLHLFHLHDDKNQTNTDENDNRENGKYYNLILTQVLVLVMMLILVLFWEPIASISFVFGIKPHLDSCPLYICLLTFGEHLFVKKLHIEKRWENDKKKLLGIQHKWRKTLRS